MVYYEMIIKSSVYSVRNCILMLSMFSPTAIKARSASGLAVFTWERNASHARVRVSLLHNVTTRLTATNTALDPPRASHHEWLRLIRGP